MDFNRMLLVWALSFNKLVRSLSNIGENFGQHHGRPSFILFHNTQPHIINKYCIVF